MEEMQPTVNFDIVPENQIKPTKPWLKSVLFAGLGLVLVSGLVFAGIQIRKKQNQPSVQLLPTPSTVTFQSPTPAEVVTPKSDPTANWRIYEVDYRSTKTFGVRLKYPDDPKWNISEVKYGVVIANRDMNFPDYSPIEHGLFKLDVSILDSEMDATQWLEEQKKTINSMTGRLDQYLNIKSITVDSRKGIYYERNDGTRDSTSTPGNVVIDAPNNHLVLFESYFDFKNNKEIFDQILSTFKFLDQSQADETANWKTYTNTKYGYEIKHPPDWKISEEKEFSPPILSRINFEKVDESQGKVAQPGNTYEEARYTIRIEVTDNPNNDSAKRNYYYNLGMVSKAEELSIAGAEGIKYINSGSGFGQLAESVANDGKLFELSYLVVQEGKYDKFMDIFNLMTSTFRFWPQENLAATPTPTPFLRTILGEKISGWPVYKVFPDFEFQYPSEYPLPATPTKNTIDFKAKDSYCILTSMKVDNAIFDYLRVIVLPKNSQDKITRTLELLGYPDYLDKEEVIIYSYPAVILEPAQGDAFQFARVLALETDSTLVIFELDQNQSIPRYWDYILRSIKIGPKFAQGNFNQRLKDCGISKDKEILWPKIVLGLTVATILAGGFVFAGIKIKKKQAPSTT